MVVEPSSAMELAAGLAAERKSVEAPVGVLGCQRSSMADWLAAEVHAADFAVPGVELLPILPSNFDTPHQS